MKGKTMSAKTDARPAPLLARFKNLVPYQSQHAQNGIPRELMEYLAASRVYPVVSPVGLVGRNAMAHVRGWPGLCITIAECVPGHGPVAHNHTGTLETFFCLDGRFDVLWGNRLEHKVTLDPGDLCSVPPGIYRTFKNLADQDGRLLVLIQGDRNMNDKIEMPRAIGEEVRKKHGEKVLDLLAAINMRFQGGETPDFAPAQMQKRVARSAALEARGNEYPVMAAKAGAAPVECWPGLAVTMLSGKPGEATSAKVDGARREWLIDIGEGEWEVASGGERTVLGRFDMVCMEPGSERTVRNISGKPARLLLASHGQETITH
jgi:uncharacterized cupin superfamily protein